MLVNHSTIIPIILCGGAGTRLWPLSRTIFPKQLLSLVDDRSMLQNTLLRIQNIIKQETPFIVCNQEYRFMVGEQIRETGIHQAHIFLEPEGRNTAPAITVIAEYLKSQAKDPLLLVMPADHVIKDIALFNSAIDAGVQLALQNYLVTFGVTPNKPETGYGYIQKGEKFVPGYQVKRFVEKPSLAKAEDYVQSGEYYWNSGIFLFRASTFLTAMREHAPDILTVCEKSVANIQSDLDFYRLNNDFLAARSESIDYAVMEKAQNIMMVPLNAEWSDVGSWDVLWQISQKDHDGNVIRGKVLIDQVSNSYLRSEKRLLAVTGLSNIAVIETSDAVLVTDRSNSQNVKTMVHQLKQAKYEEAEAHNRVYRPWGYYESLNKNDRYQVKHIVVKPGAKLSLQMHEHRSEHWVIIEGIATVTRGEEQFELTANQSVYIPVLVKHRIENKHTEPLHLIEVQTGNYLGEDDIIRFEDVYGRAETTV